jgi:pimeloyl-ACP methyl ester carboxylesterase
MGHGGGLILLPIARRGRVKSRDLVIPALVRAARRMQQHIPTEYLEEMQGLARGAAVPYDAILLENVFLTLAEQPDPTALLRLPAHCTNVVALGEATSMGQLLHASTLDWGMREVLKDRTVCLVMEPASGHPFVSITWPGMVGTLRAMGTQGIAITEESCAAKNDTHLHGIPVNLLLRKVVQHASDLDEAVRWIREGPGTCGYKITVSDGRALDARVVEVTATRSGVRAPTDGLLYGCDPAAPCLDGPCDPTIPRNDGSSARRYPAVKGLLEPRRPRLRLPDLQAALGLTEGGVLNDDTLLACVFEPQLGRFHVALRADVDPEAGTLTWRSHSLPDLLTAEARALTGPPWRVFEAGAVETKVKFEDFSGIRVEEVTFPSPVRSGVAVNDRVTAELYTPKDPIGALVQLPHWKEARGAAGQRLVALAFARQGIAVLLLPLPYQYGRAPADRRSGELTLSADLARTREAALQGAADAARASLWLETLGFAPDRQAVLGISLGGHVASLALGGYPDRFAAGGVFMLAAAGVGNAILEENGITDGIRRRLLALGVTPAEASGLLSDIDPARFALPRLADRVLLVAGTADRVASKERVEALARAWGGARIRWFEGDHYEMLRHAPQALTAVVEHLRAQFGTR